MEKAEPVCSWQCQRRIKMLLAQWIAMSASGVYVPELVVMLYIDVQRTRLAYNVRIVLQMYARW
eukprot:1013881-Alexandrium_andersonii.AAC.1